MQLDVNSPILPYLGFGNIKLYSTMDELNNILKLEGVTSVVLNDTWIQYNVLDSIELYFHKKNEKLFRITTLDKYKGKLFGKIGVGSSIEEMLQIESTFKYDEFEEVWESEKGVFIEMDAETNKVRWISVYIRELDSDDFEQANW
ncbi:hypothetical protein [Anaerosporobacter faecicola]|uniref:hypothetical protein n=1 Tax=Anaerosporobacter faecicola TaxID=2718714 RepID=UPI001438B3E3|nr:hypothetical protein [Anaerosporobacter faecicola]